MKSQFCPPLCGILFSVIPVVKMRRSRTPGTVGGWNTKSPDSRSIFTRITLLTPFARGRVDDDGILFIRHFVAPVAKGCGSTQRWPVEQTDKRTRLFPSPSVGQSPTVYFNASCPCAGKIIEKRRATRTTKVTSLRMHNRGVQFHRMVFYLSFIKYAKLSSF